jgi:hypothetical protein
MDWRKVAKFLFGGVLVIGLLIGGYLFWYYETGQNVVSRPTQPIYCEDVAGGKCAAGSESFNLSEIETCSSPDYRAIRTYIS